MGTRPTGPDHTTILMHPAGKKKLIAYHKTRDGPEFVEIISWFWGRITSRLAKYFGITDIFVVSEYECDAEQSNQIGYYSTVAVAVAPSSHKRVRGCVELANEKKAVVWSRIARWLA